MTTKSSQVTSTLWRTGVAAALCLATLAAHAETVRFPASKPEISIAFPDGWSIAAAEEDQLAIKPPETPNYGGALAELDGSMAGSAATVSERLGKALTDDYPTIATKLGISGAEAGELAVTEDNGLQFVGIRADGHLADGSEAAVVLQAFVAPSGRAFLLTLGGSTAALDQHDADLEAILDSVRLLQPADGPATTQLRAAIEEAAVIRIALREYRAAMGEFPTDDRFALMDGGRLYASATHDPEGVVTLTLRDDDAVDAQWRGQQIRMRPEIEGEGTDTNIHWQCEAVSPLPASLVPTDCVPR